MIAPYYSDSLVTIYHGDCRDVLPSLSFDVLVTDPPYGIRHASNYACASTTATWMNTEIRGDADSSLRDEALRWSGEWACFGTIKVAAPPGVRGVLVWDKGPASGMGDLSFPWKLSWELVFIAGNGWTGRRDEGVLKGFEVVTRASMGRLHPNEKPVSLLHHLIGKHTGRTVCDPFMGTGSAPIAAKDLGRRAIGIEIEERYCEIAAERCRQEVLDFGGAA